MGQRLQREDETQHFRLGSFGFDTGVAYLEVRQALAIFPRRG
jgi:hypothetical protein